MQRTHAKQWLSCVLVVAGAVSLGCAENNGNPPARTAQQPGTRTTHPAAGDQSQQASVNTMLALALDGVQLSQDQQNTVKRAKDELSAKMEPTRAAEKALLLALAEGVAAGAVDPPKLAPAVTQVTTAAAAIPDFAAVALNHLHETLKPDQRDALAAEVVERWTTASGDPTKSNRLGRPDQLRLLIDQLGMTQDQVDHVLMQSQTTMTGGAVDPWRVDLHLQRLDAFRGDAFDATTYITERARFSSAISEEATRIVRLYGAVAPLLKPEQRAKLAQLLRDRAETVAPGL